MRQPVATHMLGSPSSSFLHFLNGLPCRPGIQQMQSSRCAYGGSHERASTRAPYTSPAPAHHIDCARPIALALVLESVAQDALLLNRHAVALALGRPMRGLRCQYQLQRQQRQRVRSPQPTHAARSAHLLEHNGQSRVCSLTCSQCVMGERGRGHMRQIAIVALCFLPAVRPQVRRVSAGTRAPQHVAHTRDAHTDLIEPERW